MKIKFEAEIIEIKKTCHFCGKQFVPKDATNKNDFCSQKCYLESGRVYKPCKNCGKIFKTKKTVNTIKYCCKKCREEDRGGKFIDCAVCGKKMYVIRCRFKTQRYCSRKCEFSDKEYYKRRSGNVKFSKKGIENIRKARSGENSNWWKGGITEAIKMRFGKEEWLKLRKQVYERDNWLCWICGKHCYNNEIQAHHVIPWRIKNEDRIDNLITLCRVCHTRLENSGKDKVFLDGKINKLADNKAELISNNPEALKLAYLLNKKVNVEIDSRQSSNSWAES